MTAVEPLSEQAWEALHHASTATLTFQLLKRGYGDGFMSGVPPLRPDLRMVGYARTLRYVPMRADLRAGLEYDNRTNVQRLAVESVGVGEVLVIDARGVTNAASLGHILATRLSVRGASGIVTDGAFRDSPSIRLLDLPTYAAAANGNTALVAHHPMDLDVPIGCAGVLVMPGDVMVGDAEGVVVIPRSIAEEVAVDAEAQESLEEFILSKIEDGASILDIYPPSQAVRDEYERRTRGGTA
jgi:regulator of RNase E activity RraA